MSCSPPFYAPCAGSLAGSAVMQKVLLCIVMLAACMLMADGVIRKMEITELTELLKGRKP